MPELPEVEVVRRGLENHVLDRPIASIAVLHERPVRRHLAGAADFADVLTGRTFVAARRRGKYLWLALDGGDALLAHLGMSGQMLVQPQGADDERHLRVRFDLGDRELRFVDQRMFGGLSFSPDGADLPHEIAHIARDPLDPEFDDEAFVARARRSNSGIKRILLNQTVNTDMKFVSALGLTPDGLAVTRSAGQILDDTKGIAVDNQVQGRFCTGAVAHTLLGGLDYTYRD
ncbi:MAG: hypothetical protein EOO74_09080, partial [Myxococcales bacterium]